MLLGPAGFSCGAPATCSARLGPHKLAVAAVPTRSIRPQAGPCRESNNNLRMVGSRAAPLTISVMLCRQRRSSAGVSRGCLCGMQGGQQQLHHECAGRIPAGSCRHTRRGIVLPAMTGMSSGGVHNM